MEKLNQLQEHEHLNEADGCCTRHSHSTETHHHDHAHESKKYNLKVYFPVFFSLTLLLLGLAADHWWQLASFSGMVRFSWYLIAYLPVGWPVLKEAYLSLAQREYFNEFLLMTIATFGAFYIGEYPEGVAVMLFYSFGELLQQDAVRQARKNIRTLMDIRPKEAYLLQGNEINTVQADTVVPGSVIVVKPGEKVSLDGVLLSDFAHLNTSALTGESKPLTIEKGEKVLAGSIVIDTLIQVKSTKRFEDSSVAKIISLAQNAASQKAPTERFIRKFAKIYTPIVALCAVAIVIGPYLYSLVSSYPFNFEDWFYRALVFLVISCPCALVVSIPLGYFGGIGAASRNGILIKGGNFLDLLAKIKIIVTDKTGTITKGHFEIQNIFTNTLTTEQLLRYMASLESGSTHPIARAVVEYARKHQIGFSSVQDLQEHSGKGVTGQIDNQTIAVGNDRLMKALSVDFSDMQPQTDDAVLYCSVNGKAEGYLIIADSLKEDTLPAISELKKLGINRLVIISGDNNGIVQNVASTTGIQEAYGDCMPEDKVKILTRIKNETKEPVAFVGDGINDSPVLAISDVGIAMGQLGSDAAIEMADVVIQSDRPSKIPVAIRIGRKTQNIVLQNISLAFGVKLIVLLMGAGGVASLWEAVFADVGVALLAILNAIRIQKMNFNTND